MTDIITKSTDINWVARRIADDGTGKVVESRSGRDRATGKVVEEVIRERDPGEVQLSVIGRHAADDARFENAVAIDREQRATGTGAYALYDDPPDQGEFDGVWRDDTEERWREHHGVTTFGGLGGILGPKGSLTTRNQQEDQ